MNIYLQEYFSYMNIPNDILDFVGSDYATIASQK